MITQEKFRLLNTVDLGAAAVHYPATPPHEDGTPLDDDERALLATVTPDELREFCDLCHERARLAAGRRDACVAVSGFLDQYGAATTGEVIDRLDGPERKHFAALLAEAVERNDPDDIAVLRQEKLRRLKSIDVESTAKHLLADAYGDDD